MPNPVDQLDQILLEQAGLQDRVLDLLHSVPPHTTASLIRTKLSMEESIQRLIHVTSSIRRTT